MPAAKSLRPPAAPVTTAARRPSDWRLVAALFLCTGIAESLAFGHFQAFTPLYLRQLGVGPAAVTAWTGVLGMIGFVIGLPLLPFWGPLAERYGRKPIIVRSALIEAVIFLLASRAQSPWTLALARFLSGFVLGNTGVMLALQAEISPPARTGLAIALVSAGPSVAIAAGPLFGGLVASAFGLRRLFLLDSLLTALSAVLLMVFLREPARAPSRVSHGTGRLALQALRDVLELAPVRGAFLVYFAFALGTAAIQPFLPLWIHRAAQAGAGPLAGPPAYVIGLVLTLGGIAMAAGTPALGWLGDRLGPRTALLVSLFGNGIGLVLQFLWPQLGLLAVWRIVQGFFQGGVMATLMALLARVAPADRRASIMNLSLLPQQVGWFFGPALGTALAELWGLQPMLLAMGGLALLGAPLGLRLLPRTAAPPQPDA